jgi:hypothetical protein
MFEAVPVVPVLVEIEIFEARLAEMVSLLA